MILLAAAVATACVAVEGERITGADMARAAPAFSALPAAEPLGYAPAPGARRLFYAAELGRLAARHGITPAPLAGICFERPMERLDEARVLAALRAGLALPEARIELLDFSRHLVPRGDVEFPRTSLAAPPPAGPVQPLLWRGRVRYAERRTFPVWARVRILIRASRAVAVQDLPAGHPIAAGQVQLEEAEFCPLAEPPIHALEQVAGRVPRRSIRKGTAILAAMLEAPKTVERGQTVEVEVESGAAQLRLQARAESAGNPGDVVILRNPDNGRRFPARVESRGKVVVDAKQAAPGGLRRDVRGGARGR